MEKFLLPPGVSSSTINHATSLSLYNETRIIEAAALNLVRNVLDLAYV